MGATMKGEAVDGGGNEFTDDGTDDNGDGVTDNDTDGFVLFG